MISLNSDNKSDPEHRFALIHGPSHVTLSKGSLEVFGKIITRGKSFIIPRGKTVPAILGSETCASDLQIRSGVDGALEYVSENPIPKKWEELATQLINSPKELWIVLGGPDSGKTGLITYLANKCLHNKRKTVIIDSDIGQSSIGPPSVIGLGALSDPEIFLSQQKMDLGYFVGSTSPRNHLLQTCCGVRKLLNTAYELGAEIILLDTSGYIQDSVARTLKYHKILLVEPSSILALQRSNELEHILASVQNYCPIIRMTPPLSVTPKKVEHRTVYRETKFKKIFANSRPIPFPFSTVQLLGTSIGYETPIYPLNPLEQILNTRIIWAQKNIDRMMLIILNRFSERNLDEIKDKYQVKHVNIVFYRDLQGLLVGLHNDNHVYLALGLLQDIEFNNKIVIRTSLKHPEQVKFVTLGRIQLTPDGMQIGRIPVGFI